MKYISKNFSPFQSASKPLRPVDLQEARSQPFGLLLHQIAVILDAFDSGPTSRRSIRLSSLK
jgi:hypothetical protein